MSDSSVTDDDRLEITRRIFTAWSSGDADAPERYFHPDAVLYDVASGRFEGWPAIKAFFAAGLAKWADLTLAPRELWTNDDGVAVHYVMSATTADPAQYGDELVGRRWEVDAMSLLHFDGDRVVFEADFHDRGARARDLGIDPWSPGKPPVR